MKNILHIVRPENPLPLVFDSPHSGDIYPKDFKPACDPKDLTGTEDLFVDELFFSAPKHGATLLTALFPRAYIDANRAEDDIDPDLLTEKWPGAISPSARSDAGIGLIRRLVKPGLPVYDRPLTHAEISTRIENYYRPYHTALEKLIDAAHYNFGKVWHINCHSMPSSSARPRRAVGIAGNTSKSVDFVLGDRDGTTCDIEFTRALRDFLRGLGYSVTVNDPFKGVELIRRYSNPARGRHSLQLEINKALYMDEATNEKSAGFKALSIDIEKLMKFCGEFAAARLTDLAAD